MLFKKFVFEKRKKKKLGERSSEEIRKKKKKKERVTINSDFFLLTGKALVLYVFFALHFFSAVKKILCLNFKSKY
jgi:uncharacterized membrane protein